MTTTLVTLLCLVILVAALLVPCGLSIVYGRRAARQRAMQRLLVVQAADAQLRSLNRQAVHAMLLTAAAAMRRHPDA